MNRIPTARTPDSSGAFWHRRLKLPTVAARVVTLAFCGLLLTTQTGCPVSQALPSQAPVLDFVEPETKAAYYVYVPSRYKPERRWPLVILCHGTPPYDTAWLQMKEWAAFAEQHGIIVAAPTLEGTRGDIPPGAATQLRRQRHDESVILNVVAALRASHNIAEEQIFMTGWSGGGYAVLHTGLRHSDVFRALAIRQGNFDPDFMADTVEKIDPWQAVFIYYGAIDFVGKQAKESIKWLRDHGMYVKELQKPGSHTRQPVSIAWDFFGEITRNRPWIRVETNYPDSASPRRVRFTLRTYPEIAAVVWELGDGRTTREVEPLVEYAENGEYEVAAKVKLSNGKWYLRKTKIVIPRPLDGLEQRPD